MGKKALVSFVISILLLASSLFVFFSWTIDSIIIETILDNAEPGSLMETTALALQESFDWIFLLTLIVGIINLILATKTKKEARTNQNMNAEARARKAVILSGLSLAIVILSNF